MKVGFDLEEAIFSDEGEQSEINMPSRELIEMYNTDYSLVFNETKKFFTQCKEAISKFVSLNSYGAGFNMPFLLSKMMCMENSLEKRKGMQLDQWKIRKGKYEQILYEIMTRMGQLVEDILDLEVEVKRNYLGQEVNRKRKPKRMFAKLSKKILCESSASDTSHSIKKSILEEEQREQTKEENVLRGILQKNMLPIFQPPPAVCKLEKTPTQNLESLTKKIESLSKNIGLSRKREERIWDIFNEKRPSRPSVEVETPQAEDKDFQKINNMLSDLASQRNEKVFKKNNSNYPSITELPE